MGRGLPDDIVMILNALDHGCSNPCFLWECIAGGRGASAENSCPLQHVLGPGWEGRELQETFRGPSLCGVCKSMGSEADFKTSFPCLEKILLDSAFTRKEENISSAVLLLSSHTYPLNDIIATRDYII
jgi:hypothetical protein